ncbi:MAG: TonB-dependent receptor plug domain-containing protein, partial [Pseudomonadales bacterium]
MTGLHRGAGGLVVGAVFIWAASALPAATAAEGAIEEVVVTGSYIRRKDSFDSPSPINVIDSVNIAEQGVAAMADIIKNQTFNYGTDFVANATASTFQEGARSFANLRGLGEGATLTLVDGRRTLTGNVNILYPQIAIGRIETLKDGASALYGSDAVAGVVNVIPRKNFEGLETTLWHLQPTESRGDYDETQWNVMFGGGNEQTHLVAAFEYRERGRLRWIDRPDFNSAQFS